MRYGRLETLTQHLLTQQEHKQTAFLNTAQKKADRTYQEMVEEGIARLNKRKVRHEKNIEERKKQALTRFKMTQNLEVNHYKQTLIDQELTYCLEMMANMSTEEFCQWLESYLGQNEEQPIIYVNAARLDDVKATYPTYQVKHSAAIKLGFILSYDTFDINQDLYQVFQFKKQELLRKMGAYLFEDETK